MYKCHDCGEVFETPKSVTVSLGQCFGFPADEEQSECPICGSDDFDAAELCESCGGYFFPDDLEEGLCEDCRCAVIEDFERQFNEAEIAVIYRHMQENEVA